MMHVRDLILITLFLPAAALRNIRSDSSHHDAHQRHNTITRAMEVFVGAREAFLPAGFRGASFHVQRPPTGHFTTHGAVNRLPLALPRMLESTGKAAQLTTAGMRGTRPKPRCLPVRAVAADEQWKSFKQFNAVAWTGTATAIDPGTGVPSEPVAFEHRVTSVAPQTVRTTTVITTEPDVQAEECVRFSGALDVDLDGSYSAEHRDGLAITALLGSAEPDCIVFEHSLAVSERERRRLLLAYSEESGKLQQVLLLVEGRVGAGETALLPPPMSQTNLYALLGKWVGDAAVRSRRPAPGPRGFGRRMADVVRTAVYKARLSYGWDGGTVVVRQLQATGFGENSSAPTSTLRAVGELRRTSGQWADYEVITFPGDASFPVLLLLPAGCHALVPTQLPAAASAHSFSMEFGALVEPGESFGWKSYQPSGEAEVEAGPPEEDVNATRLARIQRLYDASGKFVSGTTSLCSAE